MEVSSHALASVCGRHTLRDKAPFEPPFVERALDTERRKRGVVDRHNARLLSYGSARTIATPGNQTAALDIQQLRCRVTVNLGS